MLKIIKKRIMREFFRNHSYGRRNIVDELLTEQPFEFSNRWQSKFFEAMRFSVKHHFENSPFYKKLCLYKGFEPSRLRAFDDVWDIPFIITDAFKLHLIETKTADMMRSEFTSSGTSGRKSRMMLNTLSGQRLLYSIYSVYKALGLACDEPANYLMMAYNPDIDDTVGTTNSDVVIANFTPQKNVFYALDREGHGPISFLKDKTVEMLKKFVDEGAPIRIPGFVHHACELIIAYNEKYGRVLFPEDSYLLTGGGWKRSVNPYGENFNLFSFLKERTNIDLKNVRDLYTLTEHPIFYLECEEHNMHIPNVSLACAREPRTLRRLPYGEKGLVHLYTPIIESAPIVSILTTDYGYINESCLCAIGGPYIKIIGRAGFSHMATCAFTADEYIQKTDKRVAVTA